MFDLRVTILLPTKLPEKQVRHHMGSVLVTDWRAILAYRRWGLY